MPSIDPHALLSSGHCMNPGDTLDGRYRITGLIGEGTFAYVYRANHLIIDTLEVAIKILKPDFVTDEELRQQFVYEAETVAVLRNKHTVRIVDMGRLPDGRPYIAMEYAAGLTLNQLLRLYGPLNSAFIALIADGVLRSLREAHDMGVIHRDIKPSNIITTRDVRGSLPLVRVLDFGIAHTIQAHSVESEESESNFVFCTPSYAAPEVLHGRPSKSADFYALGLTLAELIEGEPVYPNIGFYKVAEQQTSPDPVPFGPVTREHPFFPIIQRACHKEPYRRYATANEMLRDLEVVSRGISAHSLLSNYQPAPIGCSVPDDCAIRNNLEALARAAICPNPQCNLRLNATSSATQLADFGTLQAALNMDIDDLNFDLDAFTDTEVNPRVEAPGTQRIWTSDDPRTALRESPLETGRMPRIAPADQDNAYGTQRLSNQDLSAPPADAAIHHTPTPEAMAALDRATAHLAPSVTPVDPPAQEIDTPAPHPAPPPAVRSFLKLQRAILPRSSARNRTAWSVISGPVLLCALIYVLFSGLPTPPP